MMNGMISLKKRVNKKRIQNNLQDENFRHKLGTNRDENKCKVRQNIKQPDLDVLQHKGESANQEHPLHHQTDLQLLP